MQRGKIFARAGGLFCVALMGWMTAAFGGGGNYQPDLHIGDKRDLSAQVGGDVYDNFWSEQKLTVRMSKRARKVFWFVLENDGDVPDDLVIWSKRPPLKVKVEVFQVTGGRKNVSAEIIRTGFLLPDIAPGEGIKLRVRSKFKSGARIKKNSAGRFSARSATDHLKRDSCGALFMPRFRGRVP